MYARSRALLLALLLALTVQQAFPAGNVVRGTVQLRDSRGALLPRHGNVVVLLDGRVLRVNPATQRSPVISQRGRQFTPRVLPIVVGTTIEFLNDDDIFHNVFSLAQAHPFDLGIYPKGTSRLVRFDRPGLVPVHCNIHPNMVSHVLVLPNPHFALTDDAGRYEIRDLPDGQFTLRTWDELAPEYRRSVVLADGVTSTVDIALQRVRALTPHVNKFGRPYRAKY